MVTPPSSGAQGSHQQKDFPEQNLGGGAPEDHEHDEYAPVDHSHDEYAPVGHEHPYLELTGGKLTGQVRINVESQQALIVKKANQQTMSIWADGAVDTTKTSFKENQLVTRGYTDATYAPTDHEHQDYASDIASLQEGFDEAVLAAQEGAENIEIELQSYSKKDHTHEYLPQRRQLDRDAERQADQEHRDTG